MKKLAVLCIAALGAALLVLGTAPGASAYPELTCSLSVDRQVVNPGDTFTATGVVQGDTSKTTTWTFTWNGVTKQRTGATAEASFTAPKVTRVRKITLTGQANTSRGPCVHTIVVTVIGAQVAAPTGDDGLPNTGGPAFWLLVAGLLMLGVGGGAVVLSRRRDG